MTDSASNPDRITATTTQRWMRSPGLVAGAATGLLLAAIGLIASRIDLALLSLPLVAAVAVSWDRRPAAEDRATVTLSLADSGDSEIGYSLDIRAPHRVETTVLRYSVLGGEAREFVVATPLTGEIAGTVPLLHSGPQELVRFDYRFLGADAVEASTPQEPIIGERVVAPGHTTIRSLPLPHRLQGMTGAHESARAGDGGEFRDIHLFTAGDRLRRIDWKATARHAQNAGDLYVRRTNTLADATVLIVMDSRDDVGEQVAEWSRNSATEKGISSLDLAREAASSIANAYIAAGDRVGFQDLSSRARMVPHASGARHLWRLLRAIEVTAPSAVPFQHRRPPIVPPGALVYLLSSLLDDQSVNLALTWRGNGHRVIAVDVLPPARFARSTRYERLAHRMVMMERDDRTRILRSRGVDLLHWFEDRGSLPLSARLALLSRPPRRLGSAGVRR
ncbi:MAG TPA: DUF58 domain-containing protein [Solirubrobacteraceae bacterium]|nr:DUF58 domain-containing protein [Solirubrobacteraceae bacterium]